MIEIAVDMGVPVIDTEFSGDPNQQGEMPVCVLQVYGASPVIRREASRQSTSPIRMTS